MDDHDLLIRIDAGLKVLQADVAELKGEVREHVADLGKRVSSLERFRSWAQAYGAGVLFALTLAGLVLRYAWQFMQMRGVVP